MNVRRFNALMSSTLLHMLLLAALAPFGQSNDNAAIYYQRAIESLEDLSFSDAQWQVFFEYQGGSGGQPPAEVEAMLRQLQPAMDAMRRGSTRGYSDFGLDYSQGMGLMLPHLGKMRTLAKVLDADTKVRFHNGDTAGAARNIASITHMGSHSGDDRTLISSLVGNAVFAISDASMQLGFDHGLFNEADAAAMLKAASDLRSDDPFKMVESIMMEGDIFIGWVHDKLMEEGGAQMVADAFAMNEEESQQYLDFLNNTDITEQFAMIDTALGEVAEAFTMDDHDAAREKLTAIEEKIGNGEYGEIAMVLLPSYSKIHERMVAAEQMLAERKAMLEKFVRGELKAEDALNAAVLYMQAIDAWLKLELPQREQVRTFAREGGVVTEQLAAALTAAAPIIDTLEHAARLERCDFAVVRDRRASEVMCERYVIGMRELWDLLLSDAIAAMHRGDFDTATGRLCISLRMVPHLAADHTPAGAVTCQYAFNRSALLLAELLDGDRLSPEQLSQLRPVVLGIERRDPFGAIDTIIELRRTALSHYVRLQPPADDTTNLQQLSDDARAHYDEWTGDHFLYLRAAKEHAAALEKRGGADEILKAATDELTIERMDGIFSLDALDVIRREGGYVLSLYERGELDVFRDIEVPLLTDFHAKQMRSRSDVRTLHRVLQLSGGLDLHEVTQPPDEDASSSVR